MGLFYRLAAAVCGMDVRSLAVFRMATASTLLCSLLLRLPDMEAHYSDDGIMPRDFKLEHDPGFPWSMSIHYMSGSWKVMAALFLMHIDALVFMFVGYRTRTAAIVCWLLEISLQNRNHLVLNGGDQVCRLAHLYAMFLPIGEVWSVDAWLRVKQRQTRAANRRSRKGREARSETLLRFSDAPSRRRLTRTSLLLRFNIPTFFDETSPRLSLQRRQGLESSSTCVYSNHNLVCSMGTAAITVQVTIMYLFAGLLKNRHEAWANDYTGLKLSLHFDEFVTPLGKLFREGAPEWMLMFLTRASHLLELGCPLLTLIPVGLWSRRLGAVYKGLAVVSFFLFHLGIRLFLDIGNFSAASILMWTACIPGDFWEDSGRCCERPPPTKNELWWRRRMRESKWERKHRSPTNSNVSSRDRHHFDLFNARLSQLPAWANVLLGAIMYIVVADNMASYYKEEQRVYFPVVGPLIPIRTSMRLDQSWGMFSRLTSMDGWFENTAILRNNATLDLMGWGGPVPRKLRFLDAEDYANPALLPSTSHGKERPSWIHRRYASQRWRVFLPHLRHGKKHYMRKYGKYLCRTWNGQGYKEDVHDPGQLMSFNLRFYKEPLVCKPVVNENGEATGQCEGGLVLDLWTHKCFS